MSTTTITRRAALTGTAAATAALATGTAMANDHDRAEWLALWQHMLDQSTRACDASNDYDEARFAARRAYPQQDFRWMTVITRTVPEGPETHTWMPSRATAYHEMANKTEASLKHYYDAIACYNGAPADLEDWRKASMDDLSAWEDDCRAVDERFGVPALEAANEAEQERDTAAVKAVVDRPATNVVGVAVKLAMHRLYSGGDGTTEDELVAACDDALRLAGLPEDMGTEFDVEAEAERQQVAS